MATEAQHATIVAQRRQIIADRYVRGEPQTQIAQALGVTQQQVSYDLKAIRAAWLASAIRDYDAQIAQELAKIDACEREYWAAWTRSQQDKEIAYQEAVEGDVPDGKQKRPVKPRKKVSLRKEGQAGNAAFLDGVLKCIERRCKLLGLDAPERFDLRLNWDDMTDEQLDRLAKGDRPDKVLSA